MAPKKKADEKSEQQKYSEDVAEMMSKLRPVINELKGMEADQRREFLHALNEAMTEDDEPGLVSRLWADGVGGKTVVIIGFGAIAYGVAELITRLAAKRSFWSVLAGQAPLEDLQEDVERLAA